MRALRKIISRVLPERVKRPLRHFELAARDRIEVLSGKRDSLTPPARLQEFVGGAWGSSENHLRLLQEAAGLKPDERVLDVGCGVGRMAVPLARYLNVDGSYEGFDCWKDGIAWCRRHITPAFPNFHFKHVDIYNGVYNPTGRGRSQDLTFPYDDSSFDVAILTSVFTHMLPDDVTRYLHEIHRVLRPEGRAFVTWYLLDGETRELTRQGKIPATPHGWRLDFVYDHGVYSTISEEAPEGAVAYDIEFVRDAYAKAGYRLSNVLLGEWRGQLETESRDFQDIILAVRA